MFQQYHYVGPKKIYDSVSLDIPRQKVTNPQDIWSWIEKNEEDFISKNEVTCTYVVDIDFSLWITSRHYEHVACARRAKVLGAGEITFALSQSEIIISYISNQSTGYCPGVESWSVLEWILPRLGIEYPDYYSLALIFRICPRCHQINIIKENLYECAVCDAALERAMSFAGDML